MSGMPSHEIELFLVHRGRPVPLGLFKFGVGLVLWGGAIAAIFPIAWVDLWLLALYALPGIWLVDWGSRMSLDGVTDLISRWGWRRMRAGRAMTLDRAGVRYRGDYADGAELSVPWAQVSETVFQTGIEGSWWFCLRAPVPVQAGLVAQRLAWSPAQWAAAIAAGSATVAQRRIHENVLWFGTPFAVNLEVCPGARVGSLDRALDSWTTGRLRCRPPQPAWWKPPPFPSVGRARQRERRARTGE